MQRIPWRILKIWWRNGDGSHLPGFISLLRGSPCPHPLGSYSCEFLAPDVKIKLLPGPPKFSHQVLGMAMQRLNHSCKVCILIHKIEKLERVSAAAWRSRAGEQ